MSWFGAAFGDCSSSSCAPASAAAAALGDFSDARRAVVCIEGDCKEGEARIAQLNSFYQSAGSPAQFKSAVDAINASHQAAESLWSRQLPFSTVCCEIQAIGQQATQLVSQIATASGQAAPPDIAPPGTSLGGLAAAAAGVYVAVKLGEAAINAYANRKRR